MYWQVFFKKQTVKQIDKLPKRILFSLRALTNEIELLGPLRHNWKNFGKLKGNEFLYHCHIKHGKPTYIACWKIIDKKLKIIEVYYVGTHEKAPY